MDCVVPLAMEGRSCNAEFIHFIISDFDPSRIFARIERGFDREASGCSDASNELDDRLMIGQGSAAPVLRNMAEEAVFDLVPLGGPWREVGNADGNASAVGKALQFEFPHSRARCIAAPSVGGDEQLLGLGVGALAHTLPPIGNGANGDSGVS